MNVLSIPPVILRLGLLSIVLLWLGVLWLVAHDSFEQVGFGPVAEPSG
jgi:hypothetical protein